jgi:hypothetical protein
MLHNSIDIQNESAFNGHWLNLASFKKDKCLGPGGWSVEFLNGFCDLVEDNLIRIIEEARSTGKILGAFNSTFLAYRGSAYNVFKPSRELK